MARFHLVDDASVILRDKGVYRQARVFRLGDAVFAEQRKDAYIGLFGNAGTSVPAVSWSDLETPTPTALTNGRICFSN